ncbi:MAG: MerR family transcriptional regulator, partial [Verrucomicrobiota bacterium]
ALKAPIQSSEIQLACAADSYFARRVREEREKEREALPIDGEIPERLYSDSDLVKIGRISSVVDCECPQHLAGLLSSLNAFEDYSAACESKNEQDAELHRYLHVETAKARAAMEVALTRLMDEEGIDI